MRMVIKACCIIQLKEYFSYLYKTVQIHIKTFIGFSCTQVFYLSNDGQALEFTV